MINKIYIKDFAIINELELPLYDGLTVITGETGSGKSIVLQALNISLGGKTSKTMVRSVSERAVVETELNSKIYRRIINNSGRTKSFINDEPISEGEFRNSCYSLVDFHGQHEQQFIMNESSHIDFLDSFCGLENKVNKCSNIFNSVKQTEKRLSALIKKKQLADQQKELLNFQLNEIQSVNPLQDEDIELEQELGRLKHLDEIVETAQNVTQKLTDDDESIYNQVSMVLGQIERLENIDEKLKDYSDLIRGATVNIQEASAGLNNYINTLDHDKNRLIEVQDRLGAIDSLKRKYGGSIESILEKELNTSDELNQFSNIDDEIDRLQTSILAEKDSYKNIALQLHENRISGSSELSKSIESEMRKLNMPDAKFEIKISSKNVSDSFVKIDGQNVLTTDKGLDVVQFLLSANPGEQLKPLVEIASGGEISRIMLAVKTVFQEYDPVDSLVFDEIDSGISGNAAEKVGKSLVKLSQSKQVICITHLPQIAKMAKNHLHINKTVFDGITTVKAEYLTENRSMDVINHLTSSE
jgi:DNA repair protein RecN (Recombination protein N)